jgi:hypothetical protein
MSKAAAIRWAKANGYPQNDIKQQYNSYQNAKKIANQRLTDIEKDFKANAPARKAMYEDMIRESNKVDPKLIRRGTTNSWAKTPGKWTPSRKHTPLPPVTASSSNSSTVHSPTTPSTTPRPHTIQTHKPTSGPIITGDVSGNKGGGNAGGGGNKGGGNAGGGNKGGGGGNAGGGNKGGGGGNRPRTNSVSGSINNSAKTIKKMSHASKWMLGLGAAATIATGGAMYYRHQNKK